MSESMIRSVYVRRPDGGFERLDAGDGPIAVDPLNDPGIRKMPNKIYPEEKLSSLKKRRGLSPGEPHFDHPEMAGRFKRDEMKADQLRKIVKKVKKVELVNGNSLCVSPALEKLVQLRRIKHERMKCRRLEYEVLANGVRIMIHENPEIMAILRNNQGSRPPRGSASNTTPSSSQHKSLARKKVAKPRDIAWLARKIFPNAIFLGLLKREWKNPFHVYPRLTPLISGESSSSEEKYRKE